MAATYGFHPEALSEYAEAADYYLREASPSVAERFVAAVESAVADLVSAPLRWRVAEAPEIRRCVLNHFPFVVYYRWEATRERVTVYAVMHGSFTSCRPRVDFADGARDHLRRARQPRAGILAPWRSSSRMIGRFGGRSDGYGVT